jgi:hypothetical protein
MAIIEPAFMQLTRDLDLAGSWQENLACERFTRGQAAVRGCLMQSEPGICSVNYDPEVNAGTGVGRMRYLMQTVARRSRYDAA